MKNGFTMAEVLVALSLAAIVAALTVPLMAVQEQHSKSLRFKQAFGIASQTTSAMLQNNPLFLNGTLTNDATNHYFCQEFIRKANVMYDDNGTAVDGGGCNTASTAYNIGSYNFITANGMRWYDVEKDFADYDGNPATPDTMNIWVDVDGGKGNNTVGDDILFIVVDRNGKVYPGDATSQALLIN